MIPGLSRLFTLTESCRGVNDSTPDFLYWDVFCLKIKAIKEEIINRIIAFPKEKNMSTRTVLQKLFRKMNDKSLGDTSEKEYQQGKKEAAFADKVQRESGLSKE